MNEQVKLTKSQQSKVDYIIDLLNHSMGKHSDDYEIRKLEIEYLSPEHKDIISLYAIQTLKTATTTAFGTIIHCFITRRGKVTYIDNEDDYKSKTFRGSNIYTLICANH